MIKDFFYRFLMRRHFWRYVGYDQLGELYTSMMLRSLGLSLVGIFVPIYLYFSDYSLIAISLFMAGLFLVRAVADVLSGYLIATIGPKHVMFYSYVLQVAALLLLLTLPNYQWALWLIAVTWGTSLSMFFVSYHVDFSKIIHKDHGGKELGLMTILERVGAASGPLIGGVVATVYGAEYTIILAIILFVIASVPLFLTPEPTRRHQKLHFSGLSVRRMWRDIVSFQGMALEASIAVGLWPFYIALFIATSNTYASVGLVTTIGVVAAILTSKAVGMLIDRKKGLQLLRISVITVAAVHLFRPFIGSLGGAALVNTVNDAASTGTRLPYTKGMYSRSDDLPGFRIAYLVIMESFGDLAKATSWLLPAILLLFLDAATAFNITFVAAGLGTMLILLQRFPALPRKI